MSRSKSLAPTVLTDPPLHLENVPAIPAKADYEERKGPGFENTLHVSFDGTEWRYYAAGTWTTLPSTSPEATLTALADALLHRKKAIQAERQEWLSRLEMKKAHQAEMAVPEVFKAAKKGDFLF